MDDSVLSVGGSKAACPWWLEAVEWQKQFPGSVGSLGRAGYLPCGFNKSSLRLICDYLVFRLGMVKMKLQHSRHRRSFLCSADLQPSPCWATRAQNGPFNTGTPAKQEEIYSWHFCSFCLESAGGIQCKCAWLFLTLGFLSVREREQQSFRQKSRSKFLGKISLEMWHKSRWWNTQAPPRLVGLLL